jgi:transposase
MESPPERDAVNTLPPENLPPLEHVPLTPPARVIDAKARLALVIELVKSGESMSAFSARHGLLPRTMRHWSNVYNKRAIEIIQKQQAEAVTPKPPPAPRVAKKRRFDFKPKSEAMKAEAVRRVLAGEVVPDVARSLGVSAKVIRNWYEKQTGKKLEQAKLHKELKDMGKSIPPRAHKYAGVRDELKQEAVKMIEAGKVLKDVAKELGMSTHTIRMAFEKQTGEKLRVYKVRSALAVARAEREGAIPEVTGGRVIQTATGARRLYSEKEKILFAVRFKKLKIESISDGARALGVGASALRDWVIKFDKMKPQQKAAISNAEHGKISDETKLKAIAAIDDGRTARNIAQELGVHQDSIKHWYLKTGRKWPSQWKAKANAQNEVFKRGPNGPQKKTVARMQVREALISNGEVIAAQQLSAENVTHANGHAQPISTGKAVHDATIFLQLARDEFQKAVKAGKLRVDDPTMLLPMLALHTLSK